jgi:hypothetical protein
MVFRTALTSAARRMTLAAASQVSLDDVHYWSAKEEWLICEKAMTYGTGIIRCSMSNPWASDRELSFEGFGSAFAFAPLTSEYLLLRSSDLLARMLPWWSKEPMVHHLHCRIGLSCCFRFWISIFRIPLRFLDLFRSIEYQYCGK